MKPEIKRLFGEYLALTGDKSAAANLVLADVALSAFSLSAVQLQADRPSQSNAQAESQPGDLSVQDVAKRLNCSASTIYKMCKGGRLPHYRVGTQRGVIRIRLADLADWQEICRSLPADMSAKRRRHFGW